MLPQTATVDHAPGLERAFGDAAPELETVLRPSAGRVPERLAGSYYVNGPARFGRGAQRYEHWLDGDGMVAALHFTRGRVALVSRYVRSHKFTAEETAGLPVFRTFGTAFPGDRLQHGLALASPANVSAYPFAGTLLAFGEQGLPWELDPLTLETRGEFTFGGKLKAISPFSAHPAIDPRTGELFNFGVSFSADSPMLNLYRFAANGVSRYRVRHRLPWACSMHDFGLSERHCVFHLSPYLLDMEPLQRDGRPLMDCLSWRPELGTELWVCNREDGRLRHKVPIGGGYCLHLVHCHESEGQLHADVIEMSEPIYDQYRVPELFPEARTAAIRRYSIDLASGRRVFETTMASDILCDFPALDPRRGLGDYDCFWTLGMTKTREVGRKFFDCLLRHDWRHLGVVDRYEAPAGSYLGGEPVFLPDPQDGTGGFTLCQQFDAQTRSMEFLLFDAHDLAAGPITRLPLPQPIHLGFHATWHPRP